MAINRAPFNALIDDDGSGLTGTVWNKAAIQSVILDPVDADPTFQNEPFNAANFFGAAPLTWTVGPAAIIENRYAIIGTHLMMWSFYLSWFSGSNVLGGAPSPTIRMVIPGGRYTPSSSILIVQYCAGIAGAPAAAGLQARLTGSSAIDITKADGTNFAVSDVPGMVASLIFEVS